MMLAHIFWSRDPKHIGLHHKFLKLLRDFSTNPGRLWPMWVMWATFSPIDAFFLLFRCFVSAERPRWSPVFAPKTSSQRFLWRPGSIRTLGKSPPKRHLAVLSPCKSPVFFLLSVYDTESTIFPGNILAWEVQKIPSRRLIWCHFLSFKPFQH